MKIPTLSNNNTMWTFLTFIWGFKLCLSEEISSNINNPITSDGPKIYFYYNSPLHPSVYRVVKGSLTGIQKAFDDHNHDTIARNEEFTVLMNFSSPLYNQEREWYEIPARFCYGKDIEGCVNQTRPFDNPYLVRPSSAETPVPFAVPFSKLYNATLPDGTSVFVSGTVHEQFKTFEVNGAKYDTSSGILVSFSAVSPAKAGKISGLDFLRDKGKVLNDQPLVQCYFVEWTGDGCVPGLDNLMLGYDVKFMQLKSRRWLKAVKFPNHRDERYLQTLDIQGVGQKNYLVFKDMVLQRESSIANPFSYVFASFGEQVNTTLKSAGLGFAKGLFLGSGRYQSFSKHYEKQSNSAAMSGTEFRFLRATMSMSYLENEANWVDSFKTKWKNMLNQSNYENAMIFFREYGTHYVEQAVMGGRQETVFTIDYCEVSKEKERKLDFEADLLRPYKFYTSRGGVQAYYKYMKSHSLSKIIISGPQTTCTGGNSLDMDVCYNVTLWRSSVLINPYPIRMTLRPFYTLAKGYKSIMWIKKMYEEYLKADVDEVKISSDMKLRANCERKKPLSEESASLSVSDIAGIVIGSLSFVAVIGIIFCVYQRQRRRREEERQQQQQAAPKSLFRRLWDRLRRH